MRIGILGTGHVARALAGGWKSAGHEVVLGSRDPEGRVGLGFVVEGVAEAVAHAEVVVNATPGTVSVDLLREIGARALDGKILIDVGVGLSDDYTELAHPNSSLGEQIQAAFPRTPVVKTLCTMDSTVMTDPAALTGPSTVFLSGDAPEAKRTTARLLTDLGWPPSTHLDLGGITTARGQEHFALLFMGIANGLGAHDFNIAVVPRRVAD
ncbi:NADPH-dependent F420 reductase [Streptomyces sp. NPDC091292]|uniref:NADPH-dependent F420 reductase n=1 Tax=Streptomyces sp. NPDC091292 TaxID=3365991 RepID=UPI0037F4BB67